MGPEKNGTWSLYNQKYKTIHNKPKVKTGYNNNNNTSKKQRKQQ